MVANLAIIASLVFASRTLCGQSSRDHWDSVFHPKELAQRRDEATHEWLSSWKDRVCEKGDVKTYLLMVYTKPVPSELDSNYQEVVSSNARLKAAVKSSACDFTAQDIADQINIMAAHKKGDVAGERRFERIRLNHQELHRRAVEHQQMVQLHQQIVDGIVVIQHQLDAIRLELQSRPASYY